MFSGSSTTYEADRSMGIKNEQILLPKLCLFFKDTIVNSSKRYSIFDYSGTDGTKYELKSRRNTKTRYYTTLMPCHKVIPDTKQYFVIRFTDKDCYIEYDKAKFDLYEKQMMIDQRAGMNNKEREHFLIPIADLTDF